MSTGFAALGGRPLFSVEGTTYCWADVLAAPSSRDAIEQMRNASRQGLTCVRRSRMLDDGPDPDEVRAAARHLRYRLGLLSAEQLDAWLARWGLTVEAWTEHLRRSLLLERCAELGETVEADPFVEDEAAGEAEYVDAVCSGFLGREALRFAADVALARPAAGEAAGGRTALLEQIEAAAAEARASAASVPDVEREIAARGLDWTWLEAEVLELDDPQVACEAAICVRLDGRAVMDVAADCTVAPRCIGLYLDDAEPWLLPWLLGARPGALVGPVEHDDSYLLLAIRRRVPPASSDPELRERAASALVERAAARAVAARVEWHEHV